MRRPLCMVCLVFVMSVMLLIRIFPPPDSDYSRVDGRKVWLQGKVYQKEYRVMGDLPILIIYLESVSLIQDNSQSHSLQLQKVMCYMAEKKEPEMGSKVLIYGTFLEFPEATNPGEFDSRQYYRILGICGKLKEGVIGQKSVEYDHFREGLYQLKEKLAGRLENCFATKEASIMKTMLLGEKGGLDSDIKDLYKRNGVIHILTISGLHISMIGMGLYRLLRKACIPIVPAAVSCTIVIYLYGVMTGMGTSAFRAICMFMLHMIAVCIGRTYDMLTALSVAAVLLIIEQPMYLYHSGFLLSFGSVLGIGILFPMLQNCVTSKVPALLAGVSITLMTLPIHLTFYYEIPLYATFLNVLVLPLMPVLLSVGMLAMLLPNQLILAARIMGYVNYIILQIYEYACQLTEQLPMHTWIAGKPAMWQIAVYYGIILLLMLGHQKLPKGWIAVGLLCGIFLLTCRYDSRLQVTVLDVGQGDCIHIRSHMGKHYLIDGGSSSKNKVGTYQMLPYLKAEGVNRLEAIFVTHLDSDHCNGIIELLETLPEEGLTVGFLVLPDIGMESREGSFEKIVSLATKANIEVRYMSRGQAVEEAGMRLTCMHPSAGYVTEDANEYSLVLLLSYGSVTGLFTGDVEGRGEATAWEWMKYYFEQKGGKQLTFLKVAHHGSKNSTSEQMLSELLPKMSLISCGENNRYGHPHKELLERLETVDSRIYSTAESGAVTIRTDGKQVWISGFR